MNKRKSVFTPLQVIEFIGVNINSITLSFSLPNDRVKKVTVFYKRALKLEKLSLQKLASIMGSLAWAIPTVPFAQAHHRNLQHFYILKSQRRDGNVDYMFGSEIGLRIVVFEFMHGQWKDNIAR